MAAEKGTELIHLTYDGNFQLDTDAKVIACRIIDAKPNGDSEKQSSDDDAQERTIQVEMQLDVTTMHPQGGGQPTDNGTITAKAEGDGNVLYLAKINKVAIDRATGIITHAGVITVPNDTHLNSDLFPPGTNVKVSVDAANRLLLSECHSAGHVVDVAMAKCGQECGKVLPPTKGYHFLDGPYVEYKGAIDAKEREDFLGRLKVTYQELVDEDTPTRIETLPIDDAEPLCNRLVQNFDMKNFVSPTDPNPTVRVVTVGGGTGPCGGTHVRSTGALRERGWCVKGLKCKKGVVRVRYGPKEIHLRGG
eukprot:CAMPEP_0172532292 /NCGR_PEP_ID=MMETSP1067-20121228/5401_1 /TAXON_ID=265564 ORGANISM="Thalassiosira punctigera, Strain Tpunct2005C2" /NCGR_SAMPLE_ID=MMETSP1067 /ASSEMBLY_ACC=CAM_ASM_000444 /LENGTH=305 /DNA_ID=CAMNT_0013316797 /DNA_START=103 /DNA_END=1020 /DNA_ORIENTATION=+